MRALSPDFVPDANAPTPDSIELLHQLRRLLEREVERRGGMAGRIRRRQRRLSALLDWCDVAEQELAA